MKPIPRAGDRTTAALRQQGEQNASRIDDGFGAGGRPIEGVEIAPGDTATVMHQLGHVPAGFVVTWCEGGPPLLESVSRDKEALALRNHAALAVQVSLWVW